MSLSDPAAQPFLQELKDALKLVRDACQSHKVFEYPFTATDIPLLASNLRKFLPNSKREEPANFWKCVVALDDARPGLKLVDTLIKLFERVSETYEPGPLTKLVNRMKLFKLNEAIESPEKIERSKWVKIKKPITLKKLHKLKSYAEYTFSHSDTKRINAFQLALLRARHQYPMSEEDQKKLDEFKALIPRTRSDLSKADASIIKEIQECLDNGRTPALTDSHLRLLRSVVSPECDRYLQAGFPHLRSGATHSEIKSAAYTAFLDVRLNHEAWARAHYSAVIAAFDLAFLLGCQPLLDVIEPLLFGEFPRVDEWQATQDAFKASQRQANRRERLREDACKSKQLAAKTRLEPQRSGKNAKLARWESVTKGRKSSGK